MKGNWNPPRDTSYYVTDGYAHERVFFIPDETIDCFPAYKKGKPDYTWVGYWKGGRPKRKSEWEKRLGMKLQTMLGCNDVWKPREKGG